jgi:hypothetical protein
MVSSETISDSRNRSSSSSSSSDSGAINGSGLDEVVDMVGGESWVNWRLISYLVAGLGDRGPVSSL